MDHPISPTCICWNNYQNASSYRTHVVRQTPLQCEILYEMVRELRNTRSLSIRSASAIIARRENLSLEKVRNNFYYVIKMHAKVIVKVKRTITLECSLCGREFERVPSKLKENAEKGYNNYCSVKCTATAFTRKTYNVQR